MLAPSYLPRKSWRFDFGARGGQYTDDHQLDYVAIRSAAYVDFTSRDVAVANNGQQFSDYVAIPTSYAYYAPPEGAPA